LREQNCFPFVCDLAVPAQPCQKFLANRHPSIITFFGMIPNFEPQNVLPKLASLVRVKDRSVVQRESLPPGKIMPQA
jgi:hypothetical protein